ncbi:MAG TPA: antibiotic biosynthesis monooxygenase [Rectinemataceae bacterium]|nr:antibiotic biosynthesis monooxygenase [Rectinemataceae bacterium]
MRVLIVNVRVKPESVAQFQAATLANAAESVKEPGIASFDLLQDEEDPSHFALIEVYRDDEAQARHRQTAHYLRWKEEAEALMAEPRTRSSYRIVDGA